MNLLALIPGPARLAATVALALGLTFGGALLGVRLAASDYGSRLERLRIDCANCAVRRESAERQLQAQAEALDRLQRSAESQRKAQAQALQEARQSAEQDYLEALRILQERPAADTDRCEAARLAFDAELKRERGL